jgi:transposase-like protein
MKIGRSLCDRYGSKALRAAINAVFGGHQPVQRCRAHKLRNVLDYLPKEDKAQVKSLMRSAWKLPAEQGMARIKKLAAWLDQNYPQAAASGSDPQSLCDRQPKGGVVTSN